MISGELLNKFIENPGDYGPSVLDMAKELLVLRKAREGWKLVPVEPTEDMMAAGTAVDGGVYCIWKDMLTAAPETE